MECLQCNSAGIALVVDTEGHLLGTATDGDIRRALLKGEKLDAQISKYMGRQVITVPEGVKRANVLDMMRARFIEQIPIVDGSGKVVGLHVMREVIGAMERPNWTVIMAGGRGERLRPLTDEIPKPMLRVAGRPILERLILHLVGYGIREIYISINYLGHVIQDYFGDGRNFGCHIQYLKEDKPLHTGGALSLLSELPSDPLLVMNGDLVTNVDIQELFDFHATHGNIITVGTNDYTHTVPLGCLSIANGRVVSIEEKPVITKTANAGIYVLTPSVLAWVPKNAAFPITNLIEKAISENAQVGAFPIMDWIDVGEHDQLRQAINGKRT
jgi:dTDP-glucose pyrophosphorylase